MTHTHIMGILNVTPDSCYDGGRYLDPAAALAHAHKLHADGADILDIGGESSRPGSDPVSIEEELRRIIPVIEAVRSEVPLPLSIDTRRAPVAARAVELGVQMINDITGFSDPAMREVAKDTEVTICVMHMQGAPKTMQDNPSYPEGVVLHLLEWFDKRIEELIQSGIKEERIVLDPGIGFGKTVAHNIEILQNLPRLRALGFPLLVGVSRKDFMRKITGLEREHLLPTTLAVNTLMFMEGVEIIRVHDVAEHQLCRKVLSHFMCAESCRCG